MKKILQSKFLNKFIWALVVFILFSAFVHVGILASYVLITGKLDYLNYFKILDLDLFIPVIGTGYMWFGLGSGFIVIGMLFLIAIKRK